MPVSASRRSLLTGLAAPSLVGSVIPGRAARAQDGGAAIRIVIPYAPGGGSDHLARPIVPLLAEAMRQTVVIENRGGAAGNVGAAAVARAAPDGGLLLMANNSHTINPFLYRNPGYDMLRSFEPISLVGTSPALLVAPASLGVETVAELIALARRRPGALNFGSPGAGTPGHLASVLFNSLAAVQAVHVAYQGTGPTTVAVLAGEVQYFFGTPASLEPHVRSGALRALAVTSPRRFASFPDTPTIAETGLPALEGFDVEVWWGLLAPAGTDPRFLDRMNAAVTAAVATPRIREAWAAAGLVGRSTTREEFRTLIAADLRRWEKVVADNRITVD